MSDNSLPRYSVSDLNSAIGILLNRGFAPKFVVHASISKSQNKKGHEWLTLSDGNSFISAVIWSSTLEKLKYHPSLDDGVLIIGKLNFWAARASLCIQVLDIRPTISTVMRKFELVKIKLEKEGLMDSIRKRELPLYPKSIGVLTSDPSSALADIQKTAQDRWPLTRLVVIPIPVQGEVHNHIQSILTRLANSYQRFDIEAIILARGGGSREDLIVFDNEELCRYLSTFPVPVVTGLGHEDDLTVADLVADYRASTPTAAVIALLPSREDALAKILDIKKQINNFCVWSLSRHRQSLVERKYLLKQKSIFNHVQSIRLKLEHRGQLLKAFSPSRILAKGYAILKNTNGEMITSVKSLSKNDKLTINFSDGQIESTVNSIKIDKNHSLEKA